jgi:hypothetical protein
VVVCHGDGVVVRRSDVWILVSKMYLLVVKQGASNVRECFSRDAGFQDAFYVHDGARQAGGQVQSPVSEKRFVMVTSARHWKCRLGLTGLCHKRSIAQQGIPRCCSTRGYMFYNAVGVKQLFGVTPWPSLSLILSIMP